MKTIQSSRLELRLPKKKKTYFEEAASLGGFKNLTDFMVFSAEQHAEKIADQHKKILDSKKDQKVFFDALMKSPEPNQALKRAAKRYKQTIAGK